MTTTASRRLGHVARTARNPHTVAAFYTDLLDLQIVRQTRNPLIGDAVLLSYKVLTNRWRVKPCRLSSSHRVPRTVHRRGSCLAGGGRRDTAK